MSSWLGVVPARGAVHDEAIVAAVDRAVAGSGARAVRIHTHVDRAEPVTATTVSVLLDADVDVDPITARLATELDGTTGDAADRAVAEASSGTRGRCVRFPGVDAVVGDHRVGELLATTAIDAVVGVGVPVGADDVVATGGFLRPQVDGGRLVLLVEPAAGGRLRPVEVRSPHQCCGGLHD